MFPFLSKHAAKKDYKGLINTLEGSIDAAIAIMVPISIMFIILREPIIKLIYQHGRFDDNSTKMTAVCLLYYSIGLAPLIVRDLYSRALFALGDTIRPMINGIIGAITNIIFIVILIKPMSYAGLAASTSISYAVTMILLCISLKRRLKEYSPKKSLIMLLKVLCSAGFMALAVYNLDKLLVPLSANGFIGQIISLFISGVTGVIIYILIILILDKRAREALKKISLRLKSKLKKQGEDV